MTSMTSGAASATPPGVYIRTRKGQALVASRDLDALPPEQGRLLAMLNGFTPVHDLVRLAERGGLAVTDVDGAVRNLASAGLIEPPVGLAH